MTKLYLFNIFIALIIYCHGFAQDKYLPRSEGNLVHHNYSSLSYNEEAEQAEWVYYELTTPMVSGLVQRLNNFREDDKITTGSAQLADYAGSGYDRGHLCPAGSMSHNETAMSESFYMSNMSPQVPSFNRGKWKQLEEVVRSWVVSDSLLYVVTGPVLTDSMQVIGANKVAVPTYYYKVVYSPAENNMIAFLMPNEKIVDPIVNYATTIDQIEDLTDIDFFSDMPDEQEELLESTLDKSVWVFSVSSTLKTKSTSKENTTSSICLGISKSGERCKVRTKNSNGYCHLHQNQAP